VRRSLPRFLIATSAGCFSPTNAPPLPEPPGAKSVIFFGAADPDGAWQFEVRSLPLDAARPIAIGEALELNAAFFGCAADKLGLDGQRAPAPLPSTYAVETYSDGAWAPLERDAAIDRLSPVRVPRLESAGCENIAVRSSGELDVMMEMGSILFGTWLDPEAQTIVAGDRHGCLLLATPSREVDGAGHPRPPSFTRLPCGDLRVYNAAYDPGTDRVWGVALEGGLPTAVTIDRQANIEPLGEPPPPELGLIWSYSMLGAIRFAPPDRPFEMFAMSHSCDVGRFDGERWQTVTTATVVVDGDLTWIAPGTVLIAGICDQIENEPITTSRGCNGQLTKATIVGDDVTLERENLPTETGIIDALFTAPSGLVHAGTKSGALLTRSLTGSWSSRSLRTNEGVELLATWNDDVIVALDQQQVVRVQGESRGICESTGISHEVRGIAVDDEAIVLIGESKGGDYFQVSWLEPVDLACRLDPISRDSQ
jgi:hypothetical protein